MAKGFQHNAIHVETEGGAYRGSTPVPWVAVPCQTYFVPNATAMIPVPVWVVMAGKQVSKAAETLLSAPGFNALIEFQIAPPNRFVLPELDVPRPVLQVTRILPTS